MGSLRLILMVHFHFEWLSTEGKDIKNVRSDIEGFSLHEPLFEGNNKGPFHSETLGNSFLMEDQFGGRGFL